MALTGAFTSATQNEQPLALFREAANQVFAAPSSDADLIKQVDHERSVQVMMDSTGANAENILGGRRGGSGVAAAIQEQAKAEETAKKKNSDAQLIALLAQIDANNRQIEINEGRIDDLQEENSFLEAALERLKLGEAPPLNEDGSLEDDRLEAIVAAFEDKYGVVVDRSDPDALATIIQAKINENKAEISRISIENEALERENEVLGADVRSYAEINNVSPEELQKILITQDLDEGSERIIENLLDTSGNSDLYDQYIEEKFSGDELESVQEDKIQLTQNTVENSFNDLLNSFN